jgi:predicted HicB family RNase H-like nuclease
MRNKLYSERIELCITKKTKEALKEEADLRELTVNELIRRILEDYLEA